MAIQIIGNGGIVSEVDSYKRTFRYKECARAASYSIAAQTGTIAAALAANSSVFAMRLDPAAGASYKGYIQRVTLMYTTVVAFTTPITAGRRLALFRGTGAATSGGTALSVGPKKDSADGNSQFNSGEGGDMRIATTGALTVTGITYETEPLAIATLVHVGAAGAYYERTIDFDLFAAPVVLNQGELLAVRNPVAFDAAGTWQLGVNVEWYEGAL